MTDKDKDKNDDDIKITDKRRFKIDDEALIRDAEEEQKNESISAEDKNNETNESEIINDINLKMGFMDMINSLAGTILIQLGAVADPQTNVIKKDMNAAKQTINVLELLKEKTAGNLTNDESMMLDNVLFDMRMRYVLLTEGRKQGE